MTLFLLSQLPWVLVLVYVIRAHRQDSQARFDASCVERAEWHLERTSLLNRIQAPEAAQKQAALAVAEIPDEPPYVPWDNDDAFHEARGVEV
jgi:hypothetical protein